MNATQTAELDQLRTAIEHAPRDPGRLSPELAGWRTPGGLFVCPHCAGRIMERGCRLPTGSDPVWDKDPADSCPLC